MDPPSTQALRAAGYLALATALGHWIHGEQEVRPYVQGSPIARALAIRGWQQGAFAHAIFGLNYLRLAAVPAGARTSLDKLIFAIQARTPPSAACSRAQLVFNAFSVATLPGIGPKATNAAIGGAAALSLLIY